jgi:hypothetical protein
MINKIIFINLKNNKYTRTRNYYNGFLKLGIECSWHDVAGFSELIDLYHEIKSFQNRPTVVVTSRSQLLSIYSFFLGYRVVLDAGLPLWDGVITSRRSFGFMGWGLIKVYSTDFLSFHLSKHIIFETSTQLPRVSKMFAVKKRKLSYVLLGLDENRFSLASIDRETQVVKKSELNILFRGGNQVESGISILIEASQILKDDKRFTFTLVTNNLELQMQTKNLKLVVGHVSDDLINDLLLSADLILGQLLNHKRLDIAIPHKFYEAAFFSKPYLTADYGLMKELVNKNLVFGFKAGDVQSFIKSLNVLFDKQFELLSCGQRLGDWYKQNSSQLILTTNFYNIVVTAKK